MFLPHEEVTGGALEQSASGAAAWYHPVRFGILGVAPRYDELCHEDDAFDYKKGSDYALCIRAFPVLGQRRPGTAGLEVSPGLRPIGAYGLS